MAGMKAQGWLIGRMFPTLLCTGIATAAASALEVVGTTEATLEWEAASGAVSGYYVIISRDDQPASVEGVTLSNSETVAGEFGETVVVQVAAFGDDGVAGPVSDPSEPITFVADGGSTGGGGGGGSGGGDDGGSGGGGDGGSNGGGGSTGTAMRAVARDFDGDGLSDLLVQRDANLTLWAMQGAVVRSEIQLPLAPSGARLVGTGDYDGNGSADLLWEQSETSALVLWQLQGGVVVSTATLDRGDLALEEDWNVGGSGDMDGDGRDDIVLFSRFAGEVETWHLDAAAVVGRTRLPGRIGAVSLAVSDVDGDGLAELVWVDEMEGTLELRDPRASGPVALGKLAEGWRVRGAVDFDGDAGGELVVHEVATGAMQRWLLDDGGVVASDTLPNAQGLGVLASTGDFDGDGLEDAAWSRDGVVTLWLAGATASTPLDRTLRTDATLVGGYGGVDPRAAHDRYCAGEPGAEDTTDYDGDGDTDINDFIDGFLPAFNQLQPFPSPADHDCDGDTDVIDYTQYFLPAFQ